MNVMTRFFVVVIFAIRAMLLSACAGHRRQPPRPQRKGRSCCAC